MFQCGPSEFLGLVAADRLWGLENMQKHVLFANGGLENTQKQLLSAAFACGRPKVRKNRDTCKNTCFCAAPRFGALGSTAKKPAKTCAFGRRARKRHAKTSFCCGSSPTTRKNTCKRTHLPETLKNNCFRLFAPPGGQSQLWAASWVAPPTEV